MPYLREIIRPLQITTAGRESQEARLSKETVHLKEATSKSIQSFMNVTESDLFRFFFNNKNITIDKK